MRKIILFAVVIFCSVSTYAEYRPMSIGLVTRFSGASILSPNNYDNSAFGLSTSILEFYTEARRGSGLYTPYVQLRFSIPIEESERLDTFIRQFRWGFLFGGSHNLLPRVNKDTGIGWSLLLNGGFTVDFVSVQAYNNMSSGHLNTPVNLGGEISLRALYNFNKYAAVTFGFDLAYIMSFSVNTEIVGIPSSDFISKIFSFDQALTYGLSIGFVF